jgi:hypothetical protein
VVGQLASCEGNLLLEFRLSFVWIFATSSRYLILISCEPHSPPFSRFGIRYIGFV